MKKLKLNHLSDRQLAEKQMNGVRGGQKECSGGCCCGCPYASQGGSSISANSSANTSQGLVSPNCVTIVAEK